MSDERPVPTDPWAALRRYTPARIALGRAGPGWPTREVLAFGLAHARARDAVHQPLDAEALEAELRRADYAPLRVHSAACDRATFLTRPDLGRRLDAASAAQLDASRGVPELIVSVQDGLSALAVQRHVPRCSRPCARSHPDGPACRSSSPCRAASRSATRSASASAQDSSSC